MTDATPPKAPKAAASKPSTASKATGASKAATASAVAAPPVPPVAPTPPPPTPVQAPQPYAYAAYPQQQGPRTNALAIVSLVSSLVGLIIPFLAPLAGIITGHIALGQIKRTGEAGHGMALAGTIIGYVLAGLSLVIGIFYVIFIVAAISSGVLTGNTSI